MTLIGLAFNRKPPAVSPNDLYAEWDDEPTIAAVEGALAKFGDVVRLEATADFPFRLIETHPQIVFNMAEGLRGPNREAHVPSFCEFWNVPYTGSDPATLSLCLDKARTKEVLAHYGLPTPEFAVTSGGKRVALPAPPVIVKPLHEGSSKGIRQTAFCRTRQALRDAVQRVVLEYAQPALVERWLPGREFTCAVLGNGDDATVLPIIELNFEALPADVAAATWERAADPVGGLTPDAKFDLEGFRNALALRAEIEGQWGGKPPAPDKYYDLQYYERALKTLTR